jgi:preprotein translocase subunit SecD
MKKWKYLFIIAVILYSVWLIVPTIRFYSMPGDARATLSQEEREGFLESAIKLGLDLQGGMHLVVEIDDSKLSDDEKKDAMDRVIRILRNRVDQFGVAEPVIQKQGDRRVIIQLPGLQDPERAKDLIGKTAQLESGHDDRLHCGRAPAGYGVGAG